MLYFSGIQEKLVYLRKDLNVTAIMLGTIYPVPDGGNGYGVTDFQAVDDMFGTLKDFENMRIKAHKLGRLLLACFLAGEDYISTSEKMCIGSSSWLAGWCLSLCAWPCFLVHNADMKVILDFIPNHSSDRHAWFTKSVNREEGYEDFYIWHDGDKDNPLDGHPGVPNNWVRV